VVVIVQVTMKFDLMGIREGRESRWLGPSVLSKEAAMERERGEGRW
jgi:hypothetical protein